MATPTETDTRRARQRARKVLESIRVDIEQWVREEGVDLWQESTGTPRQRARQMNEIITRMSEQRLREDLLPWLEERREITIRRAGNSSFENMRQAFSGQVDDTALIGSAGSLTPGDHRLNSVMNNIDAGLLYEDGDSIAEELGNRVSRQIRMGFAGDEPISSSDPDQMDISTRVKKVLDDADVPQARATGDSGMTLKSKAEMISHDSVQDAHTTAAHQRYLNNGFRYARYDAVIDNKTSDVCERLDGEIIDLVENPGLKPPNHPWCRSDIIPLLEKPDQDPITEDQIGEDHLGAIRSTNQFRPSVMDTQQEYNPTVLNDLINQAEANRAI